MLNLLEVQDMWIRLPTIQLLTLVLNSRGEELERAILACPAGMDKIMAVLEDRRDEIRNELLLMLEGHFLRHRLLALLTLHDLHVSLVQHHRC